MQMIDQSETPQVNTNRALSRGVHQARSRAEPPPTVVISPELDRQIHDRLLAKDPVAPSDLAVTYLATVVRRLGARFRGVRDQTMVYDAAVDAILDYAEHPSRYDPAKLSLLGYLTMSAAGDLRKALAREQRRAMREVSLESVEERLGSWERIQRVEAQPDVEAMQAIEALAEEELWRRIAQVISDPVDQELVWLMVHGERRTPVFAAVLGIEEVDVAEQRRIVKRQKDRLKKRLQRSWERIRGEQPLQ